MAKRNIFSFFTRKREKNQEKTTINPIFQDKEERIFEVTEENGQTNILFQQEKIFTHSDKKSAVKIIFAEKNKEKSRDNNLALSVLKKVDLKKAYISEGFSSTSLFFYEKGNKANLKIYKKDKKIVYDVKAPQKNKIIQINVPRETIEIKYGYPTPVTKKHPLAIEAGKGMIELPDVTERKERKIIEQSEYDLIQCGRIENSGETNKTKRTFFSKNKQKTQKTSNYPFKTIVPAFYDGFGRMIRIKTEGWWKIVFNNDYMSFYAAGERLQIIKELWKNNGFTKEKPMLFYLTPGEIKAALEKKDETLWLLRQDGAYAVLSSNEDLSDIFETVRRCKQNKISTAVAIKPFIDENERVPEQYFLTRDHERYSITENGKKYYALDLTKEEVIMYCKNKARAVLNSGANALIAEKAQLDLCFFSLHSEEMTYAIRWAEYWHSLFPEVVREYPNVAYYTRQNSLKSADYGIPLDD